MIFQTLTLVLTLSSLVQTSLCVSLTPADHLVPPPLPNPQYLVHSNAPTYAPPIHDASLRSNIEQHGLMTRIARWFGYGSDATGPREQQLIAGTNVDPQFANPPGKHAYSYPNPKHQQQQNGKAPCHLCSKYPWVPMLPPNVHYPLIQQYQQPENWPQNHQNSEAQASKNYPQRQPITAVYNSQSEQISQQHLPVKQRAVQFHFPSFNNFQSASQQPKLPTKITQNYQRPFSPIPLPNLSASAIPPLYNAQPFHPIFTPTQSPLTQQQLPSTEPAHFAETIGAHSELQPDRVIPAQLLFNTNGKDASFEIVKSHQLTDFVSSVEYPAKYVQSPAIDLDSSYVGASHHKTQTDSINTVQYQHEHLNSNLSHHIPASQILTELGNFGEPQQSPQESTTTSYVYEETTSQYTPQFESQFLILNNQQSETIYENDNFPSASSHNITAIQQPSYNSDYEFSHTTLEPHLTQPIQSTYLEFSTQRPQQSETRFLTDHFQKPTIEFVPSLQTEFYQRHQHNKTTPSPIHRNRNRGRETPKRMLDAPIHHSSGGSGHPRPFTRDPSELDVRLGAMKEFQHPNHFYADPQHSTGPQLVTPASPVTVSSASPTPTSTYGAIDASGQFAGMSPPVPPPLSPNKGIQQIVIPYTTKNRPRPFKNYRSEDATTPIFDKWSHSNGVELHEQQESKLVSSATEAPIPPRRTTKYLTKILASNLRELLKREHEVKKNRSNSLSFDVSKLQKNIDDWTEQEYTSLSHRPSTPTIRGRSKHIPTEYLTTTTPSPRKPKTTQGFDTAELSASINNLEPLLDNRGSKRFQYVPIDDNRLIDFYDATTTSATTSTTTTTSLNISKDPTTQFIPFYIRAVPTQEPTELWKKAKVSISPQTKEKIYVVTPQPRFFPQRVYVTSTEMPLVKESSNGKSFKSPRFLVRPTPGNGTSIASYSKGFTNSAASYTPDLFGLMGLSAYVPAKPVEINDGNSKVITIMTPTSSAEKYTAKSIEGNSQKSRPKSTMSPSPR